MISLMASSSNWTVLLHEAVDIRLRYSPLVHNPMIGLNASPIDMIVPVSLAISWALTLQLLNPMLCSRALSFVILLSGTRKYPSARFTITSSHWVGSQQLFSGYHTKPLWSISLRTTWDTSLAFCSDGLSMEKCVSPGHANVWVGLFES